MRQLADLGYESRAAHYRADARKEPTDGSAGLGLGLGLGLELGLATPTPTLNPNPNQVCLLLRGFLRLHAPGTVPQPIGGCGTLTRPTVASDEVRRRFLSWDEAR